MKAQRSIETPETDYPLTGNNGATQSHNALKTQPTKEPNSRFSQLPVVARTPRSFPRRSPFAARYGDTKWKNIVSTTAAEKLQSALLNLLGTKRTIFINVHAR